MRRHASILVGLLWCLALLSLLVIGVLHTARLDLRVGKNYTDRIQARYLALAGLEKAKAILVRDAKERSRSAVNHNGSLYDSASEFREIEFGRGTFSVFRRGADEEGGGIIYGISDEESRLNVNTASSEALGKIEGMTPEVAAALADWRDGDNTVTPGGAESEYYLALVPPYQARNGPAQTIRELLMIRGISSALLFGRDTGANGLLDAEDEDGRPAFINPQVSEADLGWAAWLTVNSSTRNVNAAGQDRINAQSADENDLSHVQGLSTDIARAIVSYRGQNQLRSLGDLLDVTSQPANSMTNSAAPRGGSGPPPSQANGPKVISEDLLMDIADDLSVSSDKSTSGLININTARLGVLATLPGVDRQMAQAIVAYRQSAGFFPNIAWLMKVPGIGANEFKQIAPLVTARSETFRILSEGRIKSSGVRQRIEAVVHVGLDDASTLSYREDDL